MLRVTAVDIATGELVVLDRVSGVDLVDAVAASCAVPGAWPPVTIRDRRYMDGGIGSSINLDVADDCDLAVVLVPAGASAPSAFGAGPAAEIAAFPGAALGISLTMSRWQLSDRIRWIRAAASRGQWPDARRAGARPRLSPRSSVSDEVRIC